MMTQKRYGRPAALLAASAGLAVVLSSAALGAYAGPAHQTAPASEETPEALSWPLETDGSVTLSRPVRQPGASGHRENHIPQRHRHPTGRRDSCAGRGGRDGGGGRL